MLASQSIFILLHHTDLMAGEGLISKWENLTSTRPDLLCANPAVAEVRSILYAAVEATTILQHRFQDIVAKFNKALVSASESYESLLSVAEQMCSSGKDGDGGSSSVSSEVKDGESEDGTASERTSPLSWTDDRVALLFDELAGLVSLLHPLPAEIGQVTATLNLGLIEVSDTTTVSSLSGALLSLQDNQEELARVESCLKVIVEVCICNFLGIWKY